MYSRITQIYYRKTVGHVFTKPLQIEGTTKKKIPVSCFSLQFTFPPLGDASVCSQKMVAPGVKSFCVLEHHTSKSVVTVQRAFRAKYQTTDKTIRAWYKQFTETGCLCKQKSSGRPSTAEYRIDVCHVTRGAHRTSLVVTKKKKLFQFSCGCEQFH